VIRSPSRRPPGRAARRLARRLLVAAATAAVSAAAGGTVGATAQQAPSYAAPPDPAADSARLASETAAAAAPHLAERFGVAPLAALGPAAVEAADSLAALHAWNGSRRQPPQNGFVRSLPAPRRVRLDAGATAALAQAPLAERDGGVLAQTSLTSIGWGGSVRVAGAHRLRLHLSRVDLPAGARLWVHGAEPAAAPFGMELAAPDGGMWTPSVEGEELALDVELPAAPVSSTAAGASGPSGAGAAAPIEGAAGPAGAGQAAAATADSGYGFTIDAVLELVPATEMRSANPANLEGLASPGTARGPAPKDTSCEMDASCVGAADFPDYALARHAVALLEFIDGRQGFACTGQLLSDVVGDGIPYMLTANHCISTAQVAASAQAFFDDYTPSCNGPAPALEQLPRTAGATVLVTGDAQTASDFSLLRLGALPAGRTFLGWNASPLATPDGTLLYRLSHPDAEAQKFSTTTVDSQAIQCTGTPQPRFIYSDLDLGAAAPGSSGSAAMLAGGMVVGQLLGICGPTGVDDPCSQEVHPVDGAIAASFTHLQPFLAPVAAGHCSPGSLALCLAGQRFQVQVAWSNQFDGTSGVGHAVVGTDSTGYFYFTDPSNYELIVKILDFGTVFKVFYGELTDLQFTITVTDTRTGHLKKYTNTTGDCGGIDQTSFPAVAPTPAKAACAPGKGTLCLLDRRFAVSVTWQNQFNGTAGAGAPRSLSDLSGLFTFTDPTDVELVLKVVPFSDRIAFFYSALSDFAYAITVTDTAGGKTKTYQNPAGTFCGGIDNDAFPP